MQRMRAPFQMQPCFSFCSSFAPASTLSSSHQVSQSRVLIRHILKINVCVNSSSCNALHTHFHEIFKKTETFVNATGLAVVVFTCTNERKTPAGNDKMQCVWGGLPSPGVLQLSVLCWALITDCADPQQPSASSAYSWGSARTQGNLAFWIHGINHKKFGIS